MEGVKLGHLPKDFIFVSLIKHRSVNEQVLLQSVKESETCVFHQQVEQVVIIYSTPQINVFPQNIKVEHQYRNMVNFNSRTFTAY